MEELPQAQRQQLPRTLRNLCSRTTTQILDRSAVSTSKKLTATPKSEVALPTHMLLKKLMTSVRVQNNLELTYTVGAVYCCSLS